MKLWREVSGELVFHGIKHSIFLHTAGFALQKKTFNSQKHVFPPSKNDKGKKGSFLKLKILIPHYTYFINSVLLLLFFY